MVVHGEWGQKIGDFRPTGSRARREGFSDAGFEAARNAVNERIRFEHGLDLKSEHALPCEREIERGTPEEIEREVVWIEPHELETEIGEPRREERKSASALESASDDPGPRRFRWSMTLLAHAPEYGVAFA